jgi:hypothetical protein
MLTGLLQVRFKSNAANRSSLLQIYYKRHSIRPKYLRALQRGQLVSVNGQIRIPPLGMQGYDEHVNPYKGRIEDCRAPRIWFKD